MALPFTSSLLLDCKSLLGISLSPDGLALAPQALISSIDKIFLENKPKKSPGFHRPLLFTLLPVPLKAMTKETLRSRDGAEEDKKKGKYGVNNNQFTKIFPSKS